MRTEVNQGTVFTVSHFQTILLVIIRLHAPRKMRNHIILLVILLALCVAADNSPVLRRKLNTPGNGPPDHANGNGPQRNSGNGPPDNNGQTFHLQSLKAQEVRATNSTGNKGQDIGVRFNKFTVYENKAKPDLQAKDYPMAEQLSTLLRYYSNAYSVVTTHDYEMKGHDVEKYIEVVGGYPPRPSTDPQKRVLGRVPVCVPSATGTT